MRREECWDRELGFPRRQIREAHDLVCRVSSVGQSDSTSFEDLFGEAEGDKKEVVRTRTRSTKENKATNTQLIS